MQNFQLPVQLNIAVKYCYTCGLPVFYKTRQVCCNHRCLDKYLSALNLAKSIVEFLHAGHALLRNTGKKLILDILPKDTTTVSRFLWARNKGITQDLLDMAHCISEEWYAYKKDFKTREEATLLLLDYHKETTVDSASLRLAPDLQKPKSTGSPILKALRPSEMYHPPHYVARQRARKRKYAGYKKMEVSLPLHYDAGQRKWRHEINYAEDGL